MSLEAFKKYYMMQAPTPSLHRESTDSDILYCRAAGSNPYVIPLGGSNMIGTWGYIEAFQELIDEGVLENFDDIVVAIGSGGTVCGLTIGNYLTGQKVK